MGLNVMIWEEIITVPALMTMMEKIVLISRTTARTILVKVPTVVHKSVLMVVHLKRKGILGNSIMQKCFYSSHLGFIK